MCVTSAQDIALAPEQKEGSSWVISPRLNVCSAACCSGQGNW
jgi:hypothetical protein